MPIEVEHYGVDETAVEEVRRWLESVRINHDRIESRKRQIKKLEGKRDSLVKPMDGGGRGGPRKDFTDVSNEIMVLVKTIEQEIAELTEMRQEVMRAVEVLPEKLRLLVELRYFEGLPFWKIENRMHLGKTRVWEMHTEALKILQQLRKSERQ